MWVRADWWWRRGEAASTGGLDRGRNPWRRRLQQSLHCDRYTVQHAGPLFSSHMSPRMHPCLSTPSPHPKEGFSRVPKAQLLSQPTCDHGCMHATPMSLPYPEKCLLCMRAEETSGRQYAMKRMRKSAVVQCPEHVFCEQAITRNTAHPFCLRQYASFQDKLHLYFLFDLMPGGDLMDVLVAEAKVIKRRISQGAWKRACLAPKVPHFINL